MNDDKAGLDAYFNGIIERWEKSKVEQHLPEAVEAAPLLTTQEMSDEQKKMRVLIETLIACDPAKINSIGEHALRALHVRFDLACKHYGFDPKKLREEIGWKKPPPPDDKPVPGD